MSPRKLGTCTRKLGTGQNGVQRFRGGSNCEAAPLLFDLSPLVLPGRLGELPLAGERTRAEKRDRARGHPLPWSGAAGPPRRFASAVTQALEPTAAAVTLAEA